MAGESPDKSEQQKSPGETASNERDPRLAVLGDTGSSDGDAERSVDQPTTVFKAVRQDGDGDTRLRDAVAAWVTRADEPGDEPAPDETGSPARDTGEPSAEADEPSAASDESPGEADDVAVAEPAAEPAAESDAPVGGTAEDGAAETDDVAASGEGEEPSGEADDAEPAREADEPSAASDESPREADDVAAAEPARAAAEPARAAVEPAEPARAAGESAEPARTVSESDEPADEAQDVPGKAEQPPVDQPTAVFRAVQRTPVDQPTTALKAITRKPDPSPASESPAERTSKFVPLRGDDVRPAAKKPTAPTAPAAPAAPAAAPAPAEATATPASLTEPERTKQQPLPPRPPLDMLAELTNTPPPPETPVRTAVRRVKIWTPLVLLLAIIFAIVQFVRPLPAPTLTMTAKSSYAFDGGKPSLPWPNEGQGYMSATGLGTVDSFGEQKPVPIGSVAKAMTAYVILKEHPLKKGSKGEMIEIDALAEKEGGYDAQNESTLNTVKAGDKISEYDALAAIMIPSANNIARLLARWDAGSEAAFVKKMNDTAKELGMKNTTYTDPSGLNHTTVSSAEDQVKLGEKLVEIPALLEITAMPWWTDPSGKKWRNYNDLVPYDGALGIKTGSTTKAGGNLLFAAHKKVGDTDQLIVGAVLAQYKTPILGSAIAASKEAMLATQELLENHTVVKKGDVVGHVDDGLGGRTPVVATKDVKVVGWSGLTVELELGNGGRALPHSAPAGTQVGVLTVGEGASQVRVPVALKSAMAEPGLGDKLTRLG
ncbi:D-alanyl-D-alanine carboxypeptidase [Streptomyces sp. NPDC000229]|uniref:D-alanyl-D-alanine carboxypeptidase n=1 Tax=Streptomyces sp. NPDC000229 TaxID=3154247 RepID=UPI00332BE4A4